MPDLARIDEVCDAVVAKIAAIWGVDSQPPNGVQVDDDPEIVTDPTEANVIQGRQVYVLPDAYDNPESSARGFDWNDYTVVVIIARLYTDAFAETPLKEWVRAERYWVEQTIYQPLTDIRGERLLPDSDSGGLYPVSPSGVETPYDSEELRERKLFFSVVRVTFREDVEV